MASFQVDYVDRFVKEEYLPVKKIGRGLHGILWEGKSLNSQIVSDVAIKRIFNAFASREDAKRTYREVLYSIKFSDHPNIISIHDVFASANDMDVYLVMDKIDTDLSSVISSMTERN
jgi:serine/threonine protein kinase